MDNSKGEVKYDFTALGMIKQLCQLIKCTYPMWIAFFVLFEAVLKIIEATPYLNENWFRAYCLLAIPMLLMILPFAIHATKKISLAEVPSPVTPQQSTDTQTPSNHNP